MKNQIKFKFLFAIFLAILLIGCNKDDEQLLQQSNEQPVNLETARTSLLTEKEVKSNSLFSQLVQQTELNRFVNLSHEDYKNNTSYPFIINVDQGQLLETDKLTSIKLSLYVENQTKYDVNNLVLANEDGRKKIYWYTYHFDDNTYSQFVDKDNYEFDLKFTKRELNIAGEIVSIAEGVSTVSSIQNDENYKGSNCRIVVLLYINECNCHPEHVPGQEDQCGCTAGGPGFDVSNVLVCGSGNESGNQNGPLSVGYNQGYFSAPGYGTLGGIVHTARRPEDTGGGFGDDGFGSTPFLSDREVQIFALARVAGLSAMQENYFFQPGNQDKAAFLAALLFENRFSQRSKNVVRAIAEVMRRGNDYASQGNNFYQTINPYITENATDPTFAQRFTFNYAVLRAANENLTWWQAASLAMLDEVQTALDALGLFPVLGEPADLVNGAIYLIRGDGINAAFSFSAAVPFVGWAATGGKAVVRVVRDAGGKKVIKVLAQGTNAVQALANKVKDKVTLSVQNGVEILKDKSGRIIARGKEAVSRVLGNLVDKVNDAQRNIINQWKNTIASQSTKRKGNFGEMATDLDLADQGYIPLHTRIDNIDANGHNGIDAVFEKDGLYYIVESKFSSTTTPSLNAANPTTGLPKQMSDAWIRGGDRLRDAVGQDVAQDILDAGYTRIVATHGPNGNKIYKFVDANGNIGSTWTP